VLLLTPFENAKNEEKSEQTVEQAGRQAGRQVCILYIPYKKST
jgi:hypothetical protein